MKFNTVKRSVGVSQRSVRWLCSTLLASSPCACYSISWRPLSSFSLWIILSPPSLPNPPLFFALINHCDWCLVSLAWGLMARRRRFTSHELALPKVEAPGYPGHPPPLSDAQYIFAILVMIINSWIWRYLLFPDPWTFVKHLTQLFIKMFCLP